MADKGTVGAALLPARRMQKPVSRGYFGALSITGTAQLNEVAANTVLRIFDMRGLLLFAAESAADGTFAAYNLVAGRYLVLVDGAQTYLPEAYVVDVS